MLRMQEAGVIVVDHGAVIVEMLGDNGDPIAAKVYEAFDVGFATVNAQLRDAYAQCARPG
jgi:urocanate hydratase